VYRVLLRGERNNFLKGGVLLDIAIRYRPREDGKGNWLRNRKGEKKRKHDSPAWGKKERIYPIILLGRILPLTDKIWGKRKRE